LCGFFGISRELKGLLTLKCWTNLHNDLNNWKFVHIAAISIILSINFNSHLLSIMISNSPANQIIQIKNLIKVLKCVKIIRNLSFYHVGNSIWNHNPQSVTLKKLHTNLN
jgi:hypothetical protein